MSAGPGDGHEWRIGPSGSAHAFAVGVELSRCGLMVRERVGGVEATASDVARCGRCRRAVEGRFAP